ncbi:ATP-binding protein [Microbispora sp. CA-102843]|uniref:ATP-binding protein n=1 Tax=Microbispora sp. CA-102843 TaxID=3239952 RepID=UPI003D8B47F0
MYSTSLQHILAELERLDLLLRIQVWRARQARGEAGDLAAFYIPEAEADEFFDKALGAPVWASFPLPPEQREAAQAKLDQLAAEVGRHAAESLAQGIPLRLVKLGRMFGLTEFDLDVILLCLAPELDRGYERLYAYLHDDVTRRRPTVELALNLFCPDLAGKVAARTRLTQAGPLRASRLVDLHDEPGPLLGSSLRLEPRVAGYLLGDDSVDDRLRVYTRLVHPAVGPGEPAVPDALSRLAGQPPENCVLYLQGAYGAGRRTAAAAAFDRPLLVVAGRRLAAGDADEFTELVHLIGREARLQEALLYWEDFESAKENDTRLAALFWLLEAVPGPAFLSGSATWEPAGDLRGLTFLRIPFPLPGPGERLRLWQAALADACVPPSDLADLAGMFRLSGGQIHDAAVTARNLALARDPAATQVTLADLHAACRLHSNRRLAELAVQITPHYTWHDIVLPDDQMAQLREIYDQVRHRNLVYDTWGFDGKLAMGKGLNVLFAGSPGTGKTMAADVLAHSLGLSLYKIDLSAVVSKYIGETEKNLARIFAEATTSNAILFFDEADALFGKRTQVRDAHDRYANVETSYLLQKMEEYDGMVVLATNLLKNMDEAFVRRLHVTVEFPVPGVADRRRIWEQIWPAAMPRDLDLDLDFLARRVEVAGGSIRNIALAGAFLAAADGGMVTMAHLLHATRREYQKMGKVLTAGELGDH